MSIHRHPSLYFEDGSVVLLLPSTDESLVAYRVHRSLLSAHSEVFADLFTVPSPAVPEKYDGVPLVKLSDNAQDMEHFLNCIYVPRILMTEAITVDSVFVNGAMRLSNKYSVPFIRDFIIEKLEERWPRTYGTWVSRDLEHISLADKYKSLDNATHHGKIDGQYYCDVVGDPASAIRFGVDHNVPSLLPSAFYELSSVDPSLDLDECHTALENGDESREKAILESTKASARWSIIQPKEFRLLIGGMDKLKSHSLTTLGFWFTIPSESCERQGICEEQVSVLRNRRWGRLEYDSILRYFHLAMAIAAADQKICLKCKGVLLKKGRDEALKIWNSLPKDFSIRCLE
ncbi:hypothetical protein JAAARDRAFT_68904 [Jaapia argillacea MUCL 33604]|uniref:BTB domain-containing protein n=1 Tax=Jaapia argillacea MUCL 33604 TaxID=933084 RepID=A0A067Q4J3_9AGAM|nr:hypothetical protein JAAARDRAFT_68904 [Jaapia argillacea MUCL 33604]